MPSLVVDDVVAVPNCIRWAISDDGCHTLADQMQEENPINPKLTHSLVYDGKKYADIPEDAREVELRISPNGTHWMAMIVNRFRGKVKLVIDGVAHDLTPDVDIRELTIDDSGTTKMIVCLGGTAWRGTIAR